MKRLAWVLVVHLAVAGWAARLGGQPVDYLKEIKPLLKQRCYSCHGALQQKAELRLDTVEFIRTGSKHGPILNPKAVDDSPLLARVTSKDSDERMPPEGEALGAEQIEKLRRWIAEDAPALADEKPEADPRDHWAFRKLVRPPLPRPLRTERAMRNAIDLFLQAGREEHGLIAAPPADKAVLLRRVFLDLIGLPPRPEQFQAFLAETREDAYERVVDELLSNPQHGERWARHWMDIWRYADWYGRRHVPDVWNSAPQIWRWRDWIVKSLNKDTGYDGMILEMLAGDEIGPDDVETTVATGFLVRNWYALNPNQWMRDNVEHTAKAFLGLTLNCAHCHDHKYDPITQRDYFRFRAFFEPLGLRQDWVSGEPDPGPFQKYEYSTLRKVVTNGAIRVFDENLEAKTYLYLRGDERNFPEGKPTVEPAVPAFLHTGDLPVKEVTLPTVAHFPGAKQWIRDAHLESRVKALEEAKGALADAEQELAAARQRVLDRLGAQTARPHDGTTTNEVRVQPARVLNTPSSVEAQAFAELLRKEVTFAFASNRVALSRAELDLLKARLAADSARFAGGPGDTNDLARAASQAERLVALLAAQHKFTDAESALGLLEAEQAVAGVRRAAENAAAAAEKKAKDAEDAALKKAADQISSQRKMVEAAEAALRTNSLAYSSLGPVYPARSSGRRSALAQWIASRENPLTARVAVNHIWTRHFHAPLVTSVFDFGRNGSRPTHPELLDWLAVEFMEHGWSMKHLHRLIVTSEAYRMASQYPASSEQHSAAAVLTSLNAEGRTLNSKDWRRASALDSENRYLWRMNTSQMEAEMVRDSILHVVGDLDPRIGGPVLPNTEADKSRRRSLYFEVFPEAGGHDPFSELFDPPNPNECYRRTSTIIPQQALALTNSKLPTEESRALAKKLMEQFGGDDRAFIRAAYDSVLTRRPNDGELSACCEFLHRQAGLVLEEMTPPGGDKKGQAALTPELRVHTSLVRALFSHNDFVTIR